MTVSVSTAPQTAVAVSRVTVVAPSTRIDVALPHGATLAELLPQILRMAGADERDVDSVHGGWVLSRLGEPPLDIGRPVDVLGLRDGELLYLTSRRTLLPPPLYDDVADAVATAGSARLGRWSDRSTRGAGLVSAGLLLVASAGATVVAGPGTLAPALASFGVALLLLLVAAALSRASGDSAAATVVGVAVPVHAFVGGLLVLAPTSRFGDLGRSQVLLGLVTAVVATALAAVAVGDRRPVFLSLATAAVLGAVAAAVAVVGSVPAPGAAGVGAAVALAVAPVLPIASLRLARIALPTVPADAEDLENDATSVPDPSIADQADEADAYLSGLVCATSAAAAAGALVLATGDVTARVLAAVVVAVLLLRARVYGGTAQRAGTMLASLAAAAGLVGAAVVLASRDQRLAATGVVVVLGAVALGLGLVLPGRRPSPYWGRLVDVVEVLLLVSVVPLALGVLGVYGYLRGLGG